MSPAFFVGVAASLALWLPAPPAVFDAFTKGGDVWHTLGKTPGGRLRSVTVGTAGDQAAFVVLAVGPPGGKAFTDPVSGGSTWRTPNAGSSKTVRTAIDAHLRLPGGGKLPLPVRAQVIEVADGKVRASGFRATKAEAEAYQRMESAECTLDDFQRFVKARRKKADR